MSKYVWPVTIDKTRSKTDDVVICDNKGRFEVGIKYNDETHRNEERIIKGKPTPDQLRECWFCAEVHGYI